jgi:hypothetical protein
MQFCSQHSKDLDSAFASLSIAPNNDHNERKALRPGESRPLTPSPPKDANHWGASPPQELQLILTALRKLREGILGSSSTRSSPVFAQRVHVFNIRVAILAHHWESYLPSLIYLLSRLHSQEFPLPKSELFEMTSYLVLDLGTRQNDLGAAFALRYNSRVRHGYENRRVDAILHAVVTNNWIVFWRTRRIVDGYLRAMLHWHAETIRKPVLKAIGRTYMATDLNWVLSSTTGSDGSDMSWEELVQAEDVGWARDGDKVIIRKPKVRP